MSDYDNPRAIIFLVPTEPIDFFPDATFPSEHGVERSEELALELTERDLRPAIGFALGDQMSYWTAKLILQGVGCETDPLSCPEFQRFASGTMNLHATLHIFKGRPTGETLSDLLPQETNICYWLIDNLTCLLSANSRKIADRVVLVVGPPHLVSSVRKSAAPAWATPQQRARQPNHFGCGEGVVVEYGTSGNPNVSDTIRRPPPPP